MHISMRLGTKVRNSVNKWKATYVILVGRIYGSLKETTILKLTQYYGVALVNNVPDIAKMKNGESATPTPYKYRRKA
jgi:hypothetical protein